MVPSTLIDDWIRSALREDVGTGDATTEALIPAGRRGRAVALAKEALVVAGLDVAIRTFSLLSPSIEILARVEDGAAAGAGDRLLEMEGDLRALLMGERVALNILQHLSGVATLTRRYVEAAAGTGVKILDTRKTLPGMRVLEKYAVRVGGGANHRSSLSEGVLIKENHIHACGGLGNAVRAARGNAPYLLRIEVEAGTLDEVREALDAGVDIVLLDNMSVETVREAVRLVAGAVQLEVSGGVSLDNLRALAETGVDAISVGRITHSAPAVDISMLLEDEA